MPSLDIMKDATLRQQMKTEFTTYAPICFLYERMTSRSNVITSKLQTKFFNRTDDWLTFDGLKDVSLVLFLNSCSNISNKFK